MSAQCNDQDLLKILSGHVVLIVFINQVSHFFSFVAWQQVSGVIVEV